ncbi:unnamed protein product [Peniophora sp. CBMAI 1063]|nr:unnamed protein product [Peniophora sp. CBMAI 1063]
MDSSRRSSELKDAWSEELLALGDNVPAIESSLRDAQAVVRLHASKLNAHNIAASLPVEVLEYILLETRLCGTEDDPRFQDDWPLVTQVCHHWRRVGLAYTRLWTDIDVQVHGIPFCKEMLLRVGTRPFALNARAKEDLEFLSSYCLRERIWRQLLKLELHYDAQMAFAGSVLDIMFSHSQTDSPSVLQSLTLTSEVPRNLHWSSVRSMVPNLQTLHLSYVYPTGVAPPAFPRLTTITLTNTVVSTSDGVPGFLRLLRAMPTIETVTIANCSFTPHVSEVKVVLPRSMKCVEFKAFDSWHVHQVRALSLLMEQATGDRKFSVWNIGDDTDIHDLFAEVREAYERGNAVREILIEFRGWSYLDIRIEFCAGARDQDSQPLCIYFERVYSQHWIIFCSSLDGIDMRDVTLRVVSEDATPATYSATFNALAELQRLAVSTIYVTGAFACTAATYLFIALHMDVDEGYVDSGPTPLAFAALRDIAIGNYDHPSTDTPQDGHDIAQCSTNVDESAFHLLWYARTRRIRAMEPLRTVALPEMLLSKPWVDELNELVEEEVVSYELYTGLEGDEEGRSCRAIVLWRPLFRNAVWALWMPRFLVFAPIIGVLGLRLTRSL